MTSSKRIIRVAQIGIGEMGKVWLHFLLSNPKLMVVGLCDIDENVLNNLKLKLKDPKIILNKNYKRMISMTKPDFVLDTTPPNVRAKTLKFYFKNGINVLCEKPLVDNQRELKKIIDLSKTSDIKLMINQNYRWHSASKFISKFISDGKLGRVINISCLFRFNYNVKGWRANLKHPLLIDMAIHHFDLVRYFTRSNFSEVYCYDGTSTNVLLKMTGGESVNYSGSWSNIGENTSLFGEWLIEGSEGVLKWDGGYKITHIKQKEITVFDLKKEEKDKLEITLDEYIRCIINNSSPIISINDHAESLRISLAACKSSDIRKSVNA